MRIWVNVWVVVAVPLTLMWGFLGVVMTVESTDVWSLGLGIVWSALTVLPLGILARYVLVVSDSGLRWFRGKLRWEEVSEFVVADWTGGMLPQYVAVVVANGESTELFATCRYWRRRVVTLVAKLERERLRHVSD